MIGNGNGCGGRRMITRSGIDTNTESAKTMHSYDELCRNERCHQRNRSVALTTLQTI
jgi:hypothetical protein